MESKPYEMVHTKRFCNVSRSNGTSKETNGAGVKKMIFDLSDTRKIIVNQFDIWVDIVIEDEYGVEQISLRNEEFDKFADAIERFKKLMVLA